MQLHNAEPDRLRPLIGNSDFAQNLLAQIDQEGYAVLPGVFSHAEADIEYERMWRWVETVSKGVKRSDPSTWQRRGGHDPWPCKQRDMMQLHHAGWVFSDLREKMAERVFEKLYGTKELHSSKDGFTLQRPTERELSRPPNDHYDQGSSLAGLQCIQGSVALTDQEYEDGCFLCWPGSHRHHATIMAGRTGKRGRADFIILNESEKGFLEDQGIRPLRVPVRRGDVVLWRSDVAHKGAPPIGQRDSFRAVVYICMMPAKLTPEHVYAEKQRAYEQLHTSSHWPCQEEWFSSRDEPQFDLRPYFKEPPALTPRQRLLYGLERYGTGAPCSSLEDTLGGSSRTRRWQKKPGAKHAQGTPAASKTSASLAARSNEGYPTPEAQADSKKAEYEERLLVSFGGRLG